MKILISLLLGFILLASCGINQNNTCYLIGKVVDRNSTAIILNRVTDSPRSQGILVDIDSAGYFHYEMNFDDIEAYELIFKDELDRWAWRPIRFFPDNDTIRFVLYPMQMADSNKIIGSVLSEKEHKFNQELFEAFNSEFVFWYQEMDSLETINATDSDYAKFVLNNIDSLNKEWFWFDLKYAKKKHNLFGFSKLIRILREERDRNLIPLDTLKSYLNLFQQKFPNHRYTKIAQYRINALENIKVGGTYVDFTAPDLHDFSINLSSCISKNKLTLIDLWAPWCEASIQRSKRIMPLFEELNEKGFDIIGVVGDISSKESFIQEIEKHKYPWTVLSEINDKDNIWEKYGIPRSGGRQFLVDNKGKILAINPTPNELRRFILN